MTTTPIRNLARNIESAKHLYYNQDKITFRSFNHFLIVFFSANFVTAQSKCRSLCLPYKHWKKYNLLLNPLFILYIVLVKDDGVLFLIYFQYEINKLIIKRLKIMNWCH